MKDPLGLEQGRKTSATIETQVSKIDVDKYNEAAESLNKAAKEVEQTTKQIDAKKINHISNGIEDSIDAIIMSIQSIRSTLILLLWITISIFWIVLLGRAVTYFRRK